MSRHVLFAVLLVTLFSPWADSADERQEASPAISPADKELMLKLRSEVEALPEDVRVAKGVQVLIDNVETLESEQLRQRVYLSIGELYQELGDLDLAKTYFEKAGIKEDGSGVGAISRENLIDVLESQGELDKARHKALEYRDAPDGSDQEFADLTYRAGMAMIKLGNEDEAVDLGIDAATRRPCQATFHMLETLAGRSRTSRDSRQNEMKGYHWLASERTGDSGQSARFLSNLAHVEEDAGNIKESLRILKQIVEKHPGAFNTESHLLQISNLSLSLGDQDTSKKYLTMLLEGDYSKELKDLAQQSLDATKLIANGGRPPGPEKPPLASRNYLRLILGNLLLVVAVVVFFWTRRRRT